MAQFKRFLEQVVEMAEEGMSAVEIARATKCPLDFVEYVLESEALQCAESIAEARAS